MTKQIVSTHKFTFAQGDEKLQLESGVKIGPIDVAYETWGCLNDDKSNAILIFHALTGDAHAAGYHEGEKKPGWWDGMIGPGKAFDTDKYFVICANVLGSCKGSTGPSSMNPETGQPYGLSFPVVTIKDMVIVQKTLIDHLGITRLYATAGGSMGGLLTILWNILYPDTVGASIVIACNYRHTAQQIALHEVSRQAIMADPNWNQGNYYQNEPPARGMAISRMIGHITYMSEKSMEEKFGRRLQDKEKLGYDFSTEFEVESYLNYRGRSFVERFDANSYLYLSKALDYFDLTNSRTRLSEIFQDVQSEFLILTFKSDWLYPSAQAKELVRALKTNEVDVSYVDINSDYGHDAFLVEIEAQSKIIRHFLEKKR